MTRINKWIEALNNAPKPVSGWFILWLLLGVSALHIYSDSDPKPYLAAFWVIMVMRSIERERRENG